MIAITIVTTTVIMPLAIGFLAIQCNTLVLSSFQSSMSSTQHIAEVLVLLALFDAYCEQSSNMLAVAGDCAVC